MFKFTDYISPFWFFVALLITLILVNAFAPKKNIVVKEVTLSNHQDLVFRRKDQTCYRYKKEETQCKGKSM